MNTNAARSTWIVSTCLIKPPAILTHYLLDVFLNEAKDDDHVLLAAQLSKQDEPNTLSPSVFASFEECFPKPHNF